MGNSQDMQQAQLQVRQKPGSEGWRTLQEDIIHPFVALLCVHHSLCMQTDFWPAICLSHRLGLPD